MSERIPALTLATSAGTLDTGALKAPTVFFFYPKDNTPG